MIVPTSHSLYSIADSLNIASMERSPSDRCFPDAPWVRIDVSTLASKLN